MLSHGRIISKNVLYQWRELTVPVGGNWLPSSRWTFRIPYWSVEQQSCSSTEQFVRLRRLYSIPLGFVAVSVSPLSGETGNPAVVRHSHLTWIKEWNQASAKTVVPKITYVLVTIWCNANFHFLRLSTHFWMNKLREHHWKLYYQWYFDAI